MVALIATVAFPYAGRSLAAGDRFDASERDARTLTLLGRAKVAPRLSRKDLTTESETGVRPKRQYRRRDLVPEP